MHQQSIVILTIQLKIWHDKKQFFRKNLILQKYHCLRKNLKFKIHSCIHNNSILQKPPD